MENGKKICAENNEGKKMLGSVLQIQCLWFCRVKISHFFFYLVLHRSVWEIRPYDHTTDRLIHKKHTLRRYSCAPPSFLLMSIWYRVVIIRADYYYALCSPQNIYRTLGLLKTKRHTQATKSQQHFRIPITNESDNKSSFAAYHHIIELFLSEDKKVRKIFTVPTHHELYC